MSIMQVLDLLKNLPSRPSLPEGPEFVQYAQSGRTDLVFRDPSLKGDEFARTIMFWTNSQDMSDEAESMFHEIMARASLEDRTKMECDLFESYLIDNELEPYRNVLTYRHFPVWDTYSGRVRHRAAEGTRIITDRSEMPCAFAIVFCETANKAMVLAPSHSDVYSLSEQAHEFQWNHVDTARRLELWEIPWPVLGIPEDVDDITEEKVLQWLQFVYEPKERDFRLSKEYDRWDHQFAHMEKFVEHMPTYSEREIYYAMVPKVHEILHGLCMQQNIEVSYFN